MSDTPYENLDIGYYEFPLPTTEEFQTVRFLNKEGLSRLWNKVGDKFIRIPSAGEVGQVLTKTSGGAAWSDIDIPTIPEVIPISQGGTGVTSLDALKSIILDFPSNTDLDEYINLEET